MGSTNYVTCYTYVVCIQHDDDARTRVRVRTLPGGKRASKDKDGRDTKNAKMLT